MGAPVGKAIGYGPTYVPERAALERLVPHSVIVARQPRCSRGEQPVSPANPSPPAFQAQRPC